MSVLDELSSLKLKDLVNLSMWFWGSLHQRWRSVIEEEYGLGVASRLESKMIAGVGRSQARKIKQAFDITEKGIPGVIKMMEFAPEKFLEENFQILERTERSVTYGNSSCSAQKARVKKGKPEYPCKDPGIVYFQGLVSEIDPDIRVNCIACPPDPHPDDMWCRWKLEI
jgi:hypothetical protein